ncbi:hypothetical protein DPEC_G00233820 [Dallia pectoralis]|uniref:Uncharacterized protein n=1 Tax=Dallia pectoralis TaxID=75939 RepID=A0ACC2FXH5_DALPE|nr:hypothetical protein DPEC_G00233820 [Dallia pectoralis]
MSIDTLLEAARYLEWQAQQQQITREQEHCREKAELPRRGVDSGQQDVLTCSAQPIRFSRVTLGSNESSQDLQQQALSSPTPPPPPPVSIAVIPMVPVVTATPSLPHLPITSPITATPASLHIRGSQVIKGGSSPTRQLQPIQHQLIAQVKAEPNLMTLQTSGSQLQPPIQMPYPASIITAAATQHALLPQQAPPTQPRPNGTIVDDMRGLDGKRRPGGAGTREVHNKLEKNRRAHLKECFDTLKKNVPNVDEKKTSNLSVLRSALRYIQTLKRKEKEYEHEMERLAREKISTQQRLAELKSELSQRVDVTEIDRLLRQTVQPEDDQASTSTASEGEDTFDQDIDEDISLPLPSALPKPPAPVLQAQSLLIPHLSVTHKSLPHSSGVLTNPSPSGPPPPQAIAPAPHPHPSRPQPPHPAVQVSPTVIAHAAVSHTSVIQAVNHVLPASHKHLAHIAPSPGPASSAPQPITAATAHQTITAQPIGHITVHPVAHLGGPLPSHIYPQGVTVSQPTVVGHITHTFTHHTLPHQGNLHHVQTSHAGANGPQVNGAAMPSQGGSSLGKPTAVLAHHHHNHHHPQLVGQTAVLNPVTMVTVPPFPVSTLKLA